MGSDNKFLVKKDHLSCRDRLSLILKGIYRFRYPTDYNLFEFGKKQL